MRPEFTAKMYSPQLRVMRSEEDRRSLARLLSRMASIIERNLPATASSRVQKTAAQMNLWQRIWTGSTDTSCFQYRGNSPQNP